MKTRPDIELELRNLKALSELEVATLGQLKISGWQEIKGGSFAESLEAWQKGTVDQILGLCFLLENHPVGMALFKRSPHSPTWAPPHAATIHGLKIATPYQERGLGHKAFGLAVPYLKEQWPTISTLMLAVDADNVAALTVYRAFGMTDSGPVFEGRNGLEHRFEISLL